MDEMKELKKSVKLNLKIDNKKCEYSDWQPSCCEWCGKLKNNKRKACSFHHFFLKKRVNQYKNLSKLFVF